MENEKLKLEEFVGYLPFGLKILNGWGNIKVMNYFYLDDEGTGFIYHIKPILYPLPELNNQQLTLFSVNFRMWYNKENFDFNLMIYSDIELCHKLHIDYRNLIKRKLAININTLNND